jgi:hypothetical protein
MPCCACLGRDSLRFVRHELVTVRKRIGAVHPCNRAQIFVEEGYWSQNHAIGVPDHKMLCQVMLVLSKAKLEELL